MSTDIKREPSERLPVFEPLPATLERVIETVTTRTGKAEHETGLRVLDEGIFGLHPAQMTVVAARPACGKTSFACQMAINLAKRGKKVAFLSLEMTKELILERMFCIEYDVDALDLLRGKVTEDTQKRLSRFLVDVSPLPLRVIDDYCHDERELYTLIEHLEFRPEIIILDHLQHIKSPPKVTRWDALTEYLRYLKEVATKHRVAVVILSQINRDGDEAPSMTNLKGTGAIEEMADHVLLLHRLTEPNEDSTNFAVQVAKNRYGAAGTYFLYFDAAKTKFFNDCPFLARKKYAV